MKRTITLLLTLISLQISAQCIQKVGAGASCTFVIKTDGTLWAWGRNNYGQLGTGNTTNTAVKTQVGTATNWQSVEGGQFHTAAIKADGSLYTWGFNASGQLGINSTTNSNIPVQVSGGNVWKSVGAGYDHTVAIRTDGSLYGWGLNDHGQIGDGGSTNRSIPVRIGTDTNWASVTAGNNVTVAIKTDGTLWAWGEGSQVGDGTTADKRSPVQLGTDTNWKSVSRGVSHTLAIKTDGTLWAWGTNGRGQLGNGTTGGNTTPTQVGTDTDWESAKAGFFSSMGRKTNGTIWSWGQGSFYQLGQGTSTANVLTPTQIGTDTDWQFISIGSSSLFNEAVKNDGTFWAWGYNNYSQLGDGLTASLPVPTFISCPASISFSETACDTYTWATNGITYTQSGLYIDPVTNNDLQLTINYNTTTSTDETACETYTWEANGTTYTESGTYINSTTNASGCTDTTLLHLTIDSNTASSIDEIACETYTWDANGNTYTESGTYTNTTTGASGCTDTKTLNLTINRNTATSIDQTACGSYTWEANGTIYSDSGTYTNVTTNASGCTDTATLNLTINNVEMPIGESNQSVTADIATNATIANLVISPASILWYASSDNALAHENPIATTTALTNGATYYAVNNADGCYSAPLAVTVSVTLANDTFNNSRFSIYPNPTSGLIFITGNKNINTAAVMNVLGQQVMAKSINNREATIDISALNSGTYFLKVNAENQVKTFKIIKE
jgi:alpha-tubulin suppressor-like RCC1 family protein